MGPLLLCDSLSLPLIFPIELIMFQRGMGLMQGGGRTEKQVRKGESLKPATQ